MAEAARIVLVVEDEFLIRMMLTETLEEEGFAVLEAASADEAAKLLEGGAAPQMMITDLTLPGSMDGMELAAHVRKTSPTMPIIYVTGRPDVLAGVHMGAHDAVVAKPYLPSEVLAMVNRLLVAG